MARLEEIKVRNPETIAAWEHRHPFVVSCQIVRGNLVSQIEDGREIRVLGKDIKPEQLKKYELQNEGRYVYFPEIDEILP
ncbi:2735_t:CDS:2, partial [Cetraspora pellucida]